jgi:hypothetical protein
MRRAGPQVLREFRAPDEFGAEQRAWTVVQAAYAERQPMRRTKPRLRFALAPALALLAAGLVLSPAGARVGRIITHALGVAHASRALYSLPSPGRLLISGAGGTWTAAADGSTRHLGSWPQASWSPRGLYVAVASGDRLAAVDPHGNVRWAIGRPRVSDPRWYSPSGYRVAYLSAGTLRVIAGDGTGDHPLATHVADVAPAWRPGAALGPFELAYVTQHNRVVVRDGDTGAVLWTASPGGRPRELMWSNDGRQLVVVSSRAATIYPATGGPGAGISLPRYDTATDAALSPDGRTLALVLNRDQVVVAPTGHRPLALRQLLATGGLREVSWSPDGRWLVVALPAANQWVFVRVAGAPQVAAVGRIAQQFSAAGSARTFPRLEGWCCTTRGPAG